VENYCLNNGIKKLYSPPYNPQNNGIAERISYTLESCIKVILNASQLDYRLWNLQLNMKTIYIILHHTKVSQIIFLTKFSLINQIILNILEFLDAVLFFIIKFSKVYIVFK